MAFPLIAAVSVVFSSFHVQAASNNITCISWSALSMTDISPKYNESYRKGLEETLSTRGSETVCTASTGTCIAMWGKDSSGNRINLLQGCVHSGELSDAARAFPCPAGITFTNFPLYTNTTEKGRMMNSALKQIRMCACNTDKCNIFDVDVDCSRRENHQLKQCIKGTTERPPSASEEPMEERRDWSSVLFFPLFIILLAAVIAALIVAKKKYDARNLVDQREMDYINGMGERLVPLSPEESSPVMQMSNLPPSPVVAEFRLKALEVQNEELEMSEGMIGKVDMSDATVIARGSFGAVYRAKIIVRGRNTVEKEEVALKMYTMASSSHFFSEIRALEHLNEFPPHPHVIRMLDRGSHHTDGWNDLTWRVALEVIEEGTMRDWIMSSPIRLSQLMNASLGLLSALSYLHNEFILPYLKEPGTNKRKDSVSHNDVNTRNILMRSRRDANIVLADFGLSALQANRVDDYIPINNIGTVRYLSPEVLQNSIQLAETLMSLCKSDTYSCALVLWELLSRTEEVYSTANLPVPQYSPPYEEYMTKGVSKFEEINRIVVQENIRPSWPIQVEEWMEAVENGQELDDPIKEVLGSMCKWIKEMWHREADGRTSVASTLDRFETIKDRLL